MRKPLRGGGSYAPAESSTQLSDKCTGTVLDEAGEPLTGATVMAEGTKTGTATNIDGEFSLTGIKKGAKLTITYIGYHPVTVVWNGTPVNVTLKPQANSLDEVVVVGFGSLRKSNLTDAVSTVDTKNLVSRPVTNMSDALQGTVPGLNLSVGGKGGELGQSMNVNIRGTGTISTGSTASTLILIDGIEGNMNNLNPDDVESISVLKDAAASSIYGSRAAFGVILITTKKGKAGRTSVSYAGNARYFGPSKLPNLANSWNFANYFNDASDNGGTAHIFDQNTLDRIQDFMAGKITETTIANGKNWHFHEHANDNVDWWDTHFKWSWAQEHNLNITGGQDKLQYYISANYLGQDGNLRYGEDRFDRMSANAKINAQPYKWLDVEVNTKYMYTKLDNPLYTDLNALLYHDITRMWPMMPFNDPNGHYMRNGKLSQMTNGSRSKTSTNDVYLQGALTFHPLKGWNIYANVGLRLLQTVNRMNVNKVIEYTVDNEPVCNQGYGAGGGYNFTTGQTGAMQNWRNANHLTTSVYTDYSFGWDDHKFKVMIGANTEKFNNRVLKVQRMDLITEQVPEIGAATGTDKINDASAYSWSTAGFFGRLNYDYGDRYFVAGNIRYDGSSRFLRKDRWAWFGSFSLGWNIAGEAFMDDIHNIINQLKPRVSWGTLGNQNTNSYYPMYLTQTVNVNGGGWLMDGAFPTIAPMPGSISNSLTWETVKSLNIGADVAMFNNRLTANFDYFNRKTVNMIGPASEIAGVYGTAMPVTNNTDLTTRGWEIAVAWRDVVGKVNYNVGFSIADSRTIIDKYPNADRSLASGTYYKGQVLNDIWGYETHGIAKTQEEMDAWIANNRPSWGSGWRDGDIMFVDQNGDGIINTGANTLDDPGDRIKLGNTTPRYRFGINLGAEWNGIDFSMFWQGVGKRDLPLTGNLFWGAWAGNYWQATVLDEHLDFFREEGTTSVFGPNTDAYFPRPYLNSNKNQQIQSRYIQNGAYARLKNLQIGYTFKKSITDKIGMQNLRVYFSAENLCTIHHLPDAFDPETAYSDYDGWTGKTYPLQRTFSLGLNATF